MVVILRLDHLLAWHCWLANSEWENAFPHRITPQGRVGPNVIRAERSEQETPVQAGGIAGAHAGQGERRLPAVRSSTVGQAERWHAGVATAFSAYDTQPFLLVGTQTLFNNDLFCCYGIVRVL